MESKIKHSSTWQKTQNGESISLWSCDNTDAEKSYLFIGGVHGDEPEGVNLAHSLLTFLQAYNAGQSWTLIPCLNPEGFILQMRTNGRGVDLNRNFPSADWSDESRAPRYFPGRHAASEKETQALIQLLSEKKFDVIFHFHSWKPEIIVTGPIDLEEAKIFSESSGHPLKSDIGYLTPGSLGEYGWKNHRTPVVCIEEEEKISAEASWKKFEQAFVKILDIKI